MIPARFIVDSVFDLPGRSGLLAAGRLEQGVVKGGMTLADSVTRKAVRVLAIEFATPATAKDGRITLVVDRSDAEAVKAGAVLEELAA